MLKRLSVGDRLILLVLFGLVALACVEAALLWDINRANAVGALVLAGSLLSFLCYALITNPSRESTR